MSARASLLFALFPAHQVDWFQGLGVGNTLAAIFAGIPSAGEQVLLQSGFDSLH